LKYDLCIMKKKQIRRQGLQYQPDNNFFPEAAHKQGRECLIK